MNTPSRPGDYDHIGLKKNRKPPFVVPPHELAWILEKQRKYGVPANLRIQIKTTTVQDVLPF